MSYVNINVAINVSMKTVARAKNHGSRENGGETKTALAAAAKAAA